MKLFSWLISNEIHKFQKGISRNPTNIHYTLCSFGFSIFHFFANHSFLRTKSTSSLLSCLNARTHTQSRITASCIIWLTHPLHITLLIQLSQTKNIRSRKHRKHAIPFKKERRSNGESYP